MVIFFPRAVSVKPFTLASLYKETRTLNPLNKCKLASWNQSGVENCELKTGDESLSLLRSPVVPGPRLSQAAGFPTPLSSAPVSVHSPLTDRERPFKCMCHLIHRDISVCANDERDKYHTFVAAMETLFTQKTAERIHSGL